MAQRRRSGTTLSDDDRFNRAKARYLLGEESAIDDLDAFVAREEEARRTPQEGGSTEARLVWAKKVLAASGSARLGFKDDIPR